MVDQTQRLSRYRELIQELNETKKMEIARRTVELFFSFDIVNSSLYKRRRKNMKIIDSYNAVVGSVVAVLSYLLGPHWILFALFLGLNVADWLTGWMKSRIAHKESSSAGWKGVLKKLGYWLMIIVAFGASTAFVEIGNTIGIDLKITTLLGWFVLASLLVNEIRSIIENFVEAGFDVPVILTKGLEVADKAINQENKTK
jgi:toxin secretion/phage lysis holin|nr:MAG TPA: holin [Caudoviricetes sp.]